MSGRLPKQRSEWIDRSREVSFSLEGERLRGYQGDTITSALLGAGVTLMGRSFKYHRARSSYSAAGLDANAMFTDGTRTNLRADVEQISPGMALRAVNTFGSLRDDRMNIVDRFSKFMPVGFYYKTFHKPAWMFPFHERQIRKVAGLGAINTDFPETASPKDYAWCEVLVVGGGPAGLAAAIAAGELGLDVLLVEQDPQLGGSLAWQHGRDDHAYAKMHELIGSVEALPNVKVRTGTMVGGHYGDGWIALFDETKLTKLRAGSVVYATGAMEQPAVFGHNDLPGVMLATAAQRLIRLFAVKPFDRAVVLAGNSDGYAAALDLLDAGVQVAALIDLRPAGESSDLREQLTRAGVAIHVGHTIYETVATGNRRSVAGVVIAPIGSDGEADLQRKATLTCDGVAVSVGWMPNSSLLSQAGVRFTYDEAIHQLVVGSVPAGVACAGGVTGLYALNDQLDDGRRAAWVCAKHLGKYAEAIPPAPKPTGPASSHPYPIFKHAKKKNFVDFDEDLHLQDFINAHQEGYDSVELIKRYSTVGMGPSQGKLANFNAVRILAKLNGKSINETGTTTARPFYQPVKIGHLAGRRFHPMRQTPMHDWHAQHGAKFFHAGDWFRPEYYERDNTSREDCILAEAKQIRTGLGMIDVGTLGKLLINGPDAGRFLERIYTGRFANIAVGKYRYGLALDESGIIIEDGIIARLAEDRYYVTATSSGAAAFYRELLRWAMLWGMKVTLANSTNHLTAMNLVGPHSRAALAKVTDIDLNAGHFPYLCVRECRVAGSRAMLMRVGFVGELGYEVHVPASQGEHVWRELMQAGAAFDIAPAGIEAQRLLRLEKGHLIVSHDTDALTNPDEADVAWAIGKDKDFFIGQRSIAIHRKRKLTRRLAGLRWANDHRGPLPEECHLIIRDGRLAGRITSIAHRSTLGYPIAMAFVEPDVTPGDTVSVRTSDGTMSNAQVVSLPFYDPENQRQNV